MKNIDSKNIIIDLLQSSLAGHIDPSSNFNPTFLADAIIKKVEFNKTYDEGQSKKNYEILESIIDKINVLMLEMNLELNLLKPEEKLLGNFIKGKITTYQEILDILK